VVECKIAVYLEVGRIVELALDGRGDYMAYTLRIILLDIKGEIYPTIPTYTGIVWLLPVLPPFDTATSVPPGNELTFPHIQPQPTVPMAVLITDGRGGDVFRSGLIVLPPSPSDLTFMTGVGEITKDDLPPLLASLKGSTLNIQVPDGFRVLLGLFAFGLQPPHSITITDVQINPGEGMLGLILTGTASYNFMFIPFTTSFTYTAVLNMAPSSDAWNPHRIVRVTTSSGSFTFGRPLPPFLSSALGSVVTGEVGPRIENMLNDALTGTVNSVLADAKSVRTATSVISAINIFIKTNGIRFQIGMADFRLPVVPSLCLLEINIAPDPVEGTSVTYTIHVAACGLPMQNATVKLTNYKGGALAFTTNLQDTDVNGNTEFTGILRSFHHDATGHGGGVVDKYPYVSAFAPGSYPGTLELMLP
jgi:hypothetical protein